MRDYEESSQKGQKEESKKRFEDLKKFFNMDMKTKNILIRLAPEELDDVDEETRIEYIDKLYKQLIDFEYQFVDIFKNIPIPAKTTEAIKDYFSKTKEEFLKVNYKDSIKPVYRKLFSDMNPQLVEDVKQNFVGYTLGAYNMEEIVSQAKSINEILHITHSYITNNEKIMQSIPIIDEKENEYKYQISWRGEKTEEAQNIFNKFPLDLDVGCTDIISMQNKILMMVRDRGHALTIDISKSDIDKKLVRYFIPKLCNENMIRNLPGINSVTESGANGMFEVDERDLQQTLFQFIEKVPMDQDIIRSMDFIEDFKQPEEIKRKTIMEESLKGINLYKGQRAGLLQRMQKYFKNLLGKNEKGRGTRDE